MSSAKLNLLRNAGIIFGVTTILFSTPALAKGRCTVGSGWKNPSSTAKFGAPTKLVLEGRTKAEGRAFNTHNQNGAAMILSDTYKKLFKEDYRPDSNKPISVERTFARRDYYGTGKNDFKRQSFTCKVKAAVDESGAFFSIRVRGFSCDIPEPLKSSIKVDCTWVYHGKYNRMNVKLSVEDK